MRCLTSVIALSLVVLVAGSAQAQYKSKPRPFDGGGSKRPSVSPYMNLLNNNIANNIATNYQSLVRPQLEQQNFNAKSSSAIRSLQRGAGSAQRNLSSSEGNQKMRRTGHHAERDSYSHYYPGLNRQ